MTDPAAGALVLALGNPLMGDDGLGGRVIEQLRADDWPAAVELVDGELWGLRLLPLIECTHRLLVIDAIDVGAAPGTVVALDGADVARVLDAKVSAHEVGLRDVLALAELRGALPGEIRAVGAQPERLGFGEPLSASVERVVNQVADAARATLASWGLAARP